jgi:hypothetical protein
MDGTAAGVTHYDYAYYCTGSTGENLKRNLNENKRIHCFLIHVHKGNASTVMTTTGIISMEYEN